MLLGGARRPRDEPLLLEEEGNVKEEKGGMKQNEQEDFGKHIRYWHTGFGDGMGNILMVL
jgi:hypothetical protein